MTPDAAFSRLVPYILSLLRIITALLFLQHGLSKLVGFPAASNMPAAFTLDWFAGVLEVVGGGLLTVGLFSRVTAFIVSGEMAFAYFLVHAPRSVYPQINHGGEAILFCFVFLYVVFAGSGPLSLDAAIKGGRSQAALNPAE